MWLTIRNILFAVVIFSCQNNNNTKELEKTNLEPKDEKVKIDHRPSRLCRFYQIIDEPCLSDLKQNQYRLTYKPSIDSGWDTAVQLIRIEESDYPEAVILKEKKLKQYYWGLESEAEVTYSGSYHHLLRDMSLVYSQLDALSLEESSNLDVEEAYFVLEKEQQIPVYFGEQHAPKFFLKLRSIHDSLNVYMQEH